MRCAIWCRLPTGWDFPSENVEGVVGRVRYGNSLGTGYAVLSHVDVVPAGDGWTRPPLRQLSKTGGSMAEGQLMTRLLLSLPSLPSPPPGLRLMLSISSRGLDQLLFGTDEECAWEDMAQYARSLRFHAQDSALMATFRS